MGDYWWLLLIGGSFWVVFIACTISYLRNPDTNPHACPECGHEHGLNKQRKHCGAQDDNNGWSSDLCRCQNDYHWNYESTTV